MAGARSAPGRVATNTIARAAGEAVAKAASLAFYVVMARELGTHGYGSYVFALALTGTLLIGSGFGTDELIARQVAREHSRAGYYLANVAGLKTVTSVLLLGIAMAVVFVGSYGCRGATGGVDRRRRRGHRGAGQELARGLSGPRAAGADLGLPDPAANADRGHRDHRAGDRRRPRRDGGRLSRVLGRRAGGGGVLLSALDAVQAAGADAGRRDAHAARRVHDRPRGAAVRPAAEGRRAAAVVLGLQRRGRALLGRLPADRGLAVHPVGVRRGDAAVAGAGDRPEARPRLPARAQAPVVDAAPDRR